MDKIFNKKILIYMDKILTTSLYMCLEFFKLPQVHFQNLSFLAQCISFSIQNKIHIFWKRRGHFFAGDIKI